MKKWYFREANYRTFRKHTLTKQKPPTMRRFSKMVPLLCALIRLQNYDEFKILRRKIKMSQSLI